MEGTLEKLDESKGGMFSGSSTWKPYYFILHEDVLMFTEVTSKHKILGKLHMQISKILRDEGSDLEIRLNSGLVDISLRAKNISEKVEWKNALAKA
jgi:hypothetical protein